MKYPFISILFVLFLWDSSLAQKASLTIDDLLSIKSIREVEVSPDEQWIAYTVSTIDTAKDKSNTQVWMVSTEGGEPIPMTSKDYSASRPRWSPDGKYLSFMASKGENAKTQVWNLNRLGGEAQQVTKTKQGVSGYEWSPDGKRMLLVLKDPKPSDLTKDKKDDKKPQPNVIDRIYFKRDYAGYLDRRRTHVYVFTPGDTIATQITSGDFDDSQPVWSPDGKSIAFVSNRSDNPDLTYNTDIWIVDADNSDKGAKIRKLTTNPVSDSNPTWSPDGKSIAYITIRDGTYMPFSMEYLATIPVEGGEPSLLTLDLDRRVSSPKYSQDGTSIFFIVSNEGKQELAYIPASGGDIQKAIDEPVVTRDFALGKQGLFCLNATPHHPTAIYIWDEGEPKRLTPENQKLFSRLSTGSFERINFPSEDGTRVEGFVVKPPAFDPGKKYPLILWIHGGPISQFGYSWNSTAQLYAANGYVVLLVNPRGSLGYGEEFCKAIFADWGNKDYQDVMAGVDYMVDQGYVDAEKLGVGGWSYGGILTNYVITKTDRFKAAMSGASLGIIRANFGHDQYINWYNNEFGLPWETRELWERLSPFNDVEEITTPTLWMGGAVDWNVPIMNSEQMYLGMKLLGRETQLVVYPNEHHGIRRPSFQKDRYQRWLDWYAKYVK